MYYVTTNLAIFVVVLICFVSWFFQSTILLYSLIILYITYISVNTSVCDLNLENKNLNYQHRRILSTYHQMDSMSPHVSEDILPMLE